MQESQCKSLQQSKHHLWPQRAHMWEEKATSEGVTMQCGRCFDGVEGVMQTPRDAASSSLPLPYLCRFPSRVSRLLPKHVSLSCQPLFCLQFSSAAQSCPTLHDPMNRSMPGLPVHHQLPESTQTHVHWVGDAIQPSHPLLCPLFLLPSIFPSIRVFFNESTLRIRWPRYWSFNFSSIPSSEYSGLIS